MKCWHRSALLVCLAATAWAQNPTETRVFRARLSPANEVPALTIEASGSATLVAHVVRDVEGQIVSGSVDFYVNHAFPGATTFTGLHIHNGAAGVNGPVRIDTGITGAAPVTSASGAGVIDRQAQVRPENADSVATLRGMFENPSNYYANLHTTTNPGGAIRAQLEPVQTVSLVGLMSPGNEVPPIPDLAASGLGVFTAYITRSSVGLITSAEVIFEVKYSFPTAVTFTGFHIHTGTAGNNGPVTINSTLQRIDSDPSGAGILRYRSEVVLNAAAVSTLEGLLTNPSAYYINLHTSVNTGGAIRSQMRTMDTIQFRVPMSPANEVPAVTTVDASAFALVTARTLRGDDGAVQAGFIDFDVSFRFPDAVEFTGLHIHDGLAGANGPVRLDSGISGTNSVSRPLGFGNLSYRTFVDGGLPLASLNSLVVNPENHYVNLHTRVNPGGAVRSQMAPATTMSPVVGGVAAVGSEVTTTAPGALLSIYGRDFVKVTTDLSGWSGASMPTSLNGAQVSIGGRPAPILSVSPQQINVQVPVETQPGAREITASFDGRASAAFRAQVAAAAPSIFVWEGGAIAVKNSDFSLITPDNPARAGDIIVIYATGLGNTNPGLETGKLVVFPPAANTAAVRVTIGGRDADTIYSLASPGFVGLYQVAVRVPTGVTAGSAALVLRMEGATPSESTIAVR